MDAVRGSAGPQVSQDSVSSRRSSRAREKGDSGKSRSSQIRTEANTQQTPGLKAGQGGHQDSKSVGTKPVKARTAQKPDSDRSGVQHSHTSDSAGGARLPANTVSQPSRSSRIRTEANTQQTPGLKAGQGGHQDFKSVGTKPVKARTAQKSDSVDRRGAQHGYTSGSAAGARLPANTVSQPAPAVVKELKLAEPAPAVVTGPNKVKSIVYPWMFNSLDKKFLQLAAGLGDYRRSLGENSQNEYLINVVVSIVKQNTISSNDFAEMVVLQTATWQKITKLKYNVEQLKDEIKFIDPLTTVSSRIISIINLLANADSKETLRKVFKSKKLSDNDREGIKALIFREAVDRFSKNTLGYLEQKRDEVLGAKFPTEQAIAGFTWRVGRGGPIDYTTMGVSMLDDNFCHRAIFRCLEEFCKGIEHTNQWVNKKDSKLPITVDSFKELCSDLDKIAEYELTQSRYDQSQDEFIAPSDSQKELERACRRFLRDGSHKLSDRALIELLPCWMRGLKFRPRVSNDTDTLLCKVLAEEARRGVEKALVLWDSQTPEDKGLMRNRILEKSMPIFMRAKNAFTRELQTNARDQKNAEVAADARKFTTGKKAKKEQGELMQAVLREAARQDKNEMSVQKAKDDDDKFYEKIAKSGTRSESREVNKNKQVVLHDPNSKSKFMEKFMPQAGKKEASRIKISPKDIGIKTLDERLITKDLLRGLREFVNAFADFQPAKK